nr:MAG TPA: hypothetical protein [Caudoviricetes sp.]
MSRRSDGVKCCKSCSSGAVRLSGSELPFFFGKVSLPLLLKSKTP